LSACLLPVETLLFFLFNAPPTPQIYTLSLHDALPISFDKARAKRRRHRDSACRTGGRIGTKSAPAPPARVPAGKDRVASRALLEDRKSTRLNSSHDQISYAVFCLKKKKTGMYEL